MNNKIEPRTLPGFMELLPNEQIKFNQMLETIRSSYERFGFLPLDTPVMELSEVLLAKAGGETEKQIYRFTKGETDMSLRFDHTVPLAKFVSANYGNLSFPFKRYAIGKVYRGEKAQKGRYREFYQCDIDIIGDEKLSIINDAQIPAVIYTTFKELGFDDFTICINNRKILNGFFSSLNLNEKTTEILRTIDKIDKIGTESVKSELIRLEISEETVNKIMKFVTIDGNNNEKIEALKNLEVQNEIFQTGLQELTEVLKYISSIGIPENCYEVDLRIARGLDYYTGTVYETFIKDLREMGSVCSGGRYDNLAEYYTDKKLPGVGISIGLTRLFYQLSQKDAIKTERESISQVLVIPMDENQIEGSLEIASQLRLAGINTDLYLENGKIKKKMKYADKLSIPYVIILGEEEISSGEITLKNMKTGEQLKLSIEEIVERLGTRPKLS